MLATWSARVCVMALMFLNSVTPIGATNSPQQAASPGAAPADVEEVFVYIAVRSSRTPAASDPACDDAGFPVRNRNDSEFRALSLVRGTGRVDKNLGDALGSSVACFSARSETGRTQFFSKMVINGVTATGRGECTQRYSDFPEPRVGVQDCWLKLEQLPKGYVGGFVTTSGRRDSGRRHRGGCRVCGRAMRSGIGKRPSWLRAALRRHRAAVEGALRACRGASYPSRACLRPSFSLLRFTVPRSWCVSIRARAPSILDST